jgi:hypothetical protein
MVTLSRRVPPRYGFVSPDLALYRMLFVGRTSDFALQRADGRYYRAGQPLLDRVLHDHLTGTITAGTYVMNEQGRCSFAVFDDDRPPGLCELALLQDSLKRRGYPSYLEQSRRGGHLWLFFDQPLPASHVRSWFLPYCSTGMEFYPKQDEGNGYGSVIRLPLGIHRLSGVRYPFVHWDGESFVPQLQSIVDSASFSRRVTRIPVPADRLVPAPPEGTHAPTHQLLANTPIRHLSLSTTSIQAWCEAQDPFAVIGPSVSLNGRGLGCCPFGGHHAHGEDRHPSFKVYSPRRVGGSCWYCYTWRQGGNVFDFLCYWYDIDARTMWRRIQRGDA